ncbi:guanylate cyclase soluble subunit beta-2-like [Littorina saxatilis]|uniref:guanylate cyclase soluble subunit beta-2-like n=1 Tax=Littorina saxatilis TaxID=31220 RepID=UPI0038B5B7A7
MYGHIHIVIRDLVTESFGPEAWDKVLKEAQFNEGEHFLYFDYFNDSMTVSLIMAVSKCMEMPLSEVLEAFGDFFLKHCLRHGYDNMLRTLGRDIKTFIQSLDSMHSLLLLTYDKLVAPSFRCQLEDDGTLTLHYYSAREGLSDIVKGVVRAVGREIFQQPVKLEKLLTEKNDLGEGRSQEHSVFTVHFLDEKDVLNNLRDVEEIKRKKAEPELQKKKKITLSGDLFCDTFSYHIIFDEDLVIQQCGETLKRMIGFDIDQEGGATMDKAFRLYFPRMDLTMKNIRSFINSVFVLIIQPTENRGVHMNIKGQIRFKGQMLWLAEREMMMFIGSPLIKSLKEMKEMDVYMADIPLFDVTREIVLLYEQRSAEIGITKQLDHTTAELQKTSRALETERKKTEQLLHEMLPPKVAKALMNGIKVPPENFERVTIMFSDVVTFTNIAALCTPAQIVDMLNDMYLRFDNATTRHGVYKVETIGDAYMVVSGVPERTKDHAERVGRFCMDIVGQAAQVPSPATGNPLQIRVGMHSGPAMAGVVGVKMPRYCLFGDTVNTASRMESHGIPGRIHLSPHAFRNITQRTGFNFRLATEKKGTIPFSTLPLIIIVPSPFLCTRSLRNIGFFFKRRGEMEVKGKGKMVTHFLISDGDMSVAEPKDAFTDYPILTDSDLILDGDGDVFPDEEDAGREEGDGSEGRKESDGPKGNKEGAQKPTGLEAATPADANGSISGSRIVVPDYSFLGASTDDLKMDDDKKEDENPPALPSPVKVVEVPPPQQQRRVLVGVTDEEIRSSKTCGVL